MQILADRSPGSMNALSHAIEAWEAAVIKIDGFKKIESEDLTLLSEHLRLEDDPDSYLTSPVYYAFTGRKGLWLYRDGSAFILFCWHPNILGQILVFPPRGSHSLMFVSQFLNHIPQPPTGMRFARLKSDVVMNAVLQDAAKATKKSISLAPIIEPVMDWRYPVRVLSTETVMNMKGAGFHKIRNRVRQIEKKHPDVAIEKITTDIRPYLQEFVNYWISRNLKEPEDITSWQTLYGDLLDLWASGSLSMQGFVCRMDGDIRSLTLWDISNSSLPVANRFINLCDVDYKGLADFVMKTTAEHLFAEGILHLNLGGSENMSLDQFKNKFSPIYSINLHSMDVLYDEEDALPEFGDYPEKNVPVKYA